jgi:hypothetical protein
MNLPQRRFENLNSGYPNFSFRGLPQPLLSDAGIIPKSGPRAVPFSILSTTLLTCKSDLW